MIKSFDTCQEFGLTFDTGENVNPSQPARDSGAAPENRFLIWDSLSGSESKRESERASELERERGGEREREREFLSLCSCPF